MKEEADPYIPVIGLEVHAQLQTESKIFSGDSTRFGAEPNTQVSVITLGHPGVLPMLNRRAVEFALKMGIACGSEISRRQIFDRKNYFYPDLPKGYQITQDKTPICRGGEIRIQRSDGTDRIIRLNRIHLEEDAGKSIHQPGMDSLVDLNRAGVALIELVTEPDIYSSEEAYLVMAEIRKLLRYLDICDGNMEEGSLRCDANVSVKKKEEKILGRKVEIKNLNSFRHVQKAIDYEISRQIRELRKGNAIISETRTYDAVSGKTSGMRTKEELNDYRYFPDPDLSPLEIREEWLDEIRSEMPELPQELALRLQRDLNLPTYDAQVLTESREIATYFLEVCEYSSHYKIVSNWVMGPVKSFLNERSITIDQFPVRPETLAEMIDMIQQDKISHTTASKEIFPALLKDGTISLEHYIQQQDLVKNIESSDIRDIIKNVLSDHPEKVQAYKKGKKGLIGMFMGEVMKKTRGKADPKLTNQLIRNFLD
ncbi:MAG: Asp-tRNA(Asn)/Glu-tRNA(Gln) amidotransferase subunit GatB [Cyclobacteriaceae bacterium]|nr:Asp-tRNA(Asn)/Glu-tRNA(Gln) amidotransferase subunit GatB [Cyclobacteriaceae bacterium]